MNCDTRMFSQTCTPFPSPRHLDSIHSSLCYGLLERIYCSAVTFGFHTRRSLQLISLEKTLDSQWSGLWFQAWSRTQIQDTTTSGNELAAYGRKPTEGIRISRSHFACRGR